MNDQEQAPISRRIFLKSCLVTIMGFGAFGSLKSDGQVKVWTSLFVYSGEVPLYTTIFPEPRQRLVKVRRRSATPALIPLYELV